MSALFNQTNIAPGTAFVSGGGGSSSNTPNPSFSTITVAGAGLFGGNVAATTANVSSITVSQTGLFGGNLRTNGDLQFSIFNAGATSAILTGIQDNKSARQATITSDGTTPTFLQAAAFCATTGGSGIPFYTGLSGEPYIYTSYNSSNVDILKTQNNQVALTNISSINGVVPGGSGPIQLLVLPEGNVSLTLAGGDNYLASTFRTTARLDANSIYRLTFKGSLVWTGTADTQDWAQLYVQLTPGEPPDDLRIYPILPYLPQTYGGNTSEYINLESLLRTTSEATFDMSLNLNWPSSPANVYSLNVNWISLQNMGVYS